MAIVTLHVIRFLRAVRFHDGFHVLCAKNPVRRGPVRLLRPHRIQRFPVEYRMQHGAPFPIPSVHAVLQNGTLAALSDQKKAGVRDCARRKRKSRQVPQPQPQEPRWTQKS